MNTWRDHPRWCRYAEYLRIGRPAVLMLDYDGTLAPFHRDPMQAFPYPWVDGLLRQLEQLGTRVVLVTGRSIASLLHVYPQDFEVWASHGAEHRDRSGVVERLPLPEIAAEALHALEQRLLQPLVMQYRAELEHKPYGLGLHLRGLEPDTQRLIADVIQREGQPAPDSPVQLLPFHEGWEYRWRGVHKGRAVEHVLQQSSAETVVSYVGDDTTDEDAFAALGTRGLSIRIAIQPRPTLAELQLTNALELESWLRDWLAACHDGRHQHAPSPAIVDRIESAPPARRARC